MTRNLQSLILALDSLLLSACNGRYRIVLWDHEAGRNGNYIYADQVEPVD